MKKLKSSLAPTISFIIAALIYLPHVLAQDLCAAKPEEVEITVMGDWLPWASQGPMFAAQLNGYYDQEGLKVKVIAPANPADPIKLVAREKVAFSLTYVPEVLMSRDTGIPVVSVATTLRVIRSGLLYVADSIHGPADLKGKILGVGPKLDAQAYLGTLLESGGLTKKDVQIVDPGYSQVPFLLAGKVDAVHALTYYEEKLADEELGKTGKPKSKILMYTDFGVPPFYYQLFVASENWLKTHGSTTCRFLRATRKGLDVWLKAPEPVLALMAKENTALTLEEHRALYEGSKPDWLGSDGTVFKQDGAVWRQAEDYALKNKLITVGEDPGGYFTNKYLP